MSRPPPTRRLEASPLPRPLFPPTGSRIVSSLASADPSGLFFFYWKKWCQSGKNSPPFDHYSSTLPSSSLLRGPGRFTRSGDSFFNRQVSPERAFPPFPSCPWDPLLPCVSTEDFPLFSLFCYGWKTDSPFRQYN